MREVRRARPDTSSRGGHHNEPPPYREAWKRSGLVRNVEVLAVCVEMSEVTARGNSAARFRNFGHVLQERSLIPRWASFMYESLPVFPRGRYLYLA